MIVIVRLPKFERFRGSIDQFQDESIFTILTGQFTMLVLRKDLVRQHNQELVRLHNQDLVLNRDVLVLNHN